jgi:hypothetical protein
LENKSSGGKNFGFALENSSPACKIAIMARTSVSYGKFHSRFEKILVCLDWKIKVQVEKISVSPWQIQVLRAKLRLWLEIRLKLRKISSGKIPACVGKSRVYLEKFPVPEM